MGETLLGKCQPTASSEPRKKEANEKPVVAYTALLANLAIAATKLIAAVLSGSSAMLAAGIHCLVDTGSDLPLHGSR